MDLICDQDLSAEKSEVIALGDGEDLQHYVSCSILYGCSYILSCDVFCSDFLCVPVRSVWEAVRATTNQPQL